MDLEAAGAQLRAGGLVAFPTETVYGLGANALDPTAVARIFEAKHRPSFDPLIVHVSEVAAIEPLVVRFPDAAQRLADAFWPGPLTVIVEKTQRVPDIVTAGNPTVALRIPDHPIALGLIDAAQTPVAAPSANRFGSVSPTTAEHVRAQLGHAVDLILNGGPCTVGVESTIISVVERPRLLRPGGVPLEEIERVIGTVEIPPPTEARTASPGRLSKHYATRTPLRFASGALPSGKRLGLLTLTKPDDPSPYVAVETLSETGDLREAAAALFAAMRRLDAQGLDLIIATEVPEVGLGRAVMDRLRRAAV